MNAASTGSSPVRQLVTARDLARAAGRAPARIHVLVDEACALLGDRPSAGDHAELVRRCLAAGRGPGLPPGPGGRRSGTEG